ncbi:MAG: 16S rRNA (cytosine(967)-C(5))-methyltransferase RsmB [Oscillospiraceae bacterium]|nr:16S rRNA (cytosine(967)-C(5))-methyltransferase RsmB [Oscillospiraceae bacterium]
MSALDMAYRLIRRVEQNAYSNIALDSEFTSSELSDKEKRLAARLFYGTIERRITLEHILEKYLSKPLSKLDAEVRITLMLGVYQLLYVNSVPDNAAVYESAELVKRLRKASAAGMVNAILRSFIRDGKAILDEDKLWVKYSCPQELTERISEGYGRDKCISLLEASLKASKTVLRVNTLKTDGEALISDFGRQGISAEISDIIPDCIVTEGLRNVDREENYLKGLYHVQDISSQLCCMAVNPERGEIVIDACSAPGGKAFTMAELMEGGGKIYACELHEKRTELIRSGAARLGLTNIAAVTGDARNALEALPMADKVLCDVPCSGYGVIRNKPELKYKPLSQSERLPKIQLAILTSASRRVKSGGLLVYSTCTVNIKENEDVVNAFLSANPDFYGEDFDEAVTSAADTFKGKFMTAVFPDKFECDGFFICRLRRR